MKNKHPIPIGLYGTNLPPAQENAIRRAHVKFLAVRADFRKRRISFLDEIRGEFPAQRMQERRAREPAHARRHDRRRKRKNEQYAD
jgi:hypothetical protein